MTIKIGVIGAGSIVRHRHLPELKENPYVEVAGICDLVIERAKELTNRYGGKPYSDYLEMLESPDISAIVVAATNNTHASMSIEAMESGKDVLCEKPMATNLYDAENMIETAQRTGKKLMIAHNQRLEPANIKAKEIIGSGKLGKVLTWRSVFGHSGCEDWAIDGVNTWFFRKDITGLGCLGDLGIHKIDLVRWILNDDFCEVSSMAATLNKAYPDGQLIDVEDNALCLLRTKKGILGTLITSWTYQKEDNSTVFYCENGVLRLNADPEYSIIIDYDHTRSEFHKTGKRSTNVEQVKTGIIDEFISHLQNNTQPSISGMEGYKALQTVLACQQSAKEARVIKI